MKLFEPQVRGSKPACAAFTLVEMIIAVALGVLVSGIFVLFSESTGRTLVSLTSQSSHNQAAGNGAEFMISRVRLANSASVDASGNTLTLSFDDNPDVDSNADKIKWNDQDHFELFQYKDSDGIATTLGDNIIIYKPNTNQSASSTLIPNSTRKISSLPIFSIVGSNTVLINFGLLTTNSSPFSQAIEIRTRAVLRNKTS